jgi:acyl-CoA dehydrogenase
LAVSFVLTDEQRELRELASTFAREELRPVAADADAAARFPPGLLARAAALGLVGAGIPAEYGGRGADPLATALVAEELAWGCAGLCGTITATMFAAAPILLAGTEAQRRRFLPWLAAPEGTLGAIALTERQAGSDLGGLRTVARRVGGGYELSGEKRYVTNGGIADVTIVFALAEAGLTAFVVERGDDGVRAGPADAKLGLRASHTGTLVLDAVGVAEDRRLGPEGSGLALALAFFAWSRPQVAAEAVGLARAAYEYAAAYACERHAFGAPIAARQGVSFKLADMAVAIEAARLLVWRACASDGDEPERRDVLAAAAKVLASETAMRTAADAVQILGAAGATDEHPVGKWLRDAKLFEIVEGTSEIQRQLIGAAVARSARASQAVLSAQSSG